MTDLAENDTVTGSDASGNQLALSICTAVSLAVIAVACVLALPLKFVSDLVVANLNLLSSSLLMIAVIVGLGIWCRKLGIFYEALTVTGGLFLWGFCWLTLYMARPETFPLVSFFTLIAGFILLGICTWIASVKCIEGLMRFSAFSFTGVMLLVTFVGVMLTVVLFEAEAYVTNLLSEAARQNYGIPDDQT